MLNLLRALFSTKPATVQVSVKAHQRAGRRVKAHERTIELLPGEIVAEKRRQKEGERTQKRVKQQKAVAKPSPVSARPQTSKTRQKPYRSPDLPRWNPTIWYEAEQIILHIDNFKHLTRYSGDEKRLAIRRVREFRNVVSRTALLYADELEAWMRKTPVLYE